MAHEFTDPFMSVLMTLLSLERTYHYTLGRKRNSSNPGLSKDQIKSCIDDALKGPIGRQLDQTRSISDAQKDIISKLGNIGNQLTELVTIARMKWGG